MWFCQQQFLLKCPWTIICAETQDARQNKKKNLPRSAHNTPWRSVRLKLWTIICAETQDARQKTNKKRKKRTCHDARAIRLAEVWEWNCAKITQTDVHHFTQHACTSLLEGKVNLHNVSFFWNCAKITQTDVHHFTQHVCTSLLEGKLNLRNVSFLRF